jgi:hypothetical protein
MSDLSSLYFLVKPYVPSCPEAAIDAELVMAAKQLAVKTLAFRDTEYLDSQFNWGVYDLGIPDDRSLEVVTNVCVNGYHLEALTQKPCDGCTGDIGYWVDRNKTLHIYPAPSLDQEGGIEFEYAYSPRLSSCNIDDDVIEKYAQDIAYGALSRLTMMPETKWFNPKLAEFYTTMWNAAKVSALTDGSSPYTRGTISIQGFGQDYLDV